MKIQQCSSELDWLAFCYAAGELDLAQAEQFEARLADEQAAREALARAVELTQVVAAAEAQSGELVTLAAPAKSDWNTRLSWMAIGGLASLLLAVLWSGVVGPTWRTAERSFHSQSRQDLALAWFETREEIAGAPEAGLWPTTAAMTDFEDQNSGLSPMDESLEEAPSWLTAAVVSMASRDAAPPKPAEPSET